MNNRKISHEDLTASLGWRYAVKKFDADRKISPADWRTLEESLLLAPSSFGLQPYKFVVVTDPVTKREMLPHAMGQTQVMNCSHLIVIAAKNDLTDGDIDDFVDLITETRGTPRAALADYEAVMKNFRKTAEDGGLLKEWMARQTHLPLGFLLESAALLGVDACPMESFDREEFTRILGLDEEGYAAIVACALGFRDERNDWLASLAKVRKPREQILRHV